MSSGAFDYGERDLLPQGDYLESGRERMRENRSLLDQLAATLQRRSEPTSIASVQLQAAILAVRRVQAPSQVTSFLTISRRRH